MFPEASLIIPFFFKFQCMAVDAILSIFASFLFSSLSALFLGIPSCLWNAIDRIGKQRIESEAEKEIST